MKSGLTVRTRTAALASVRRISRPLVVHLATLALLGSICGAIATSPPAPCDAIEITVGVSERRCLQPSSGKTTWFSDCPDCPEMVVVPNGSFTMGAGDDDPGREVQLRVSIPRPFAVGRFSVTRSEFAAFANETKRKRENGCYAYTGSKM